MRARAPVTAASPWLPFEDRRRARDEKSEAVLRTAVRLFLEQGYHRATLNDVAIRLNITKPALYNYFRSKDEILFACWIIGRERVHALVTEIDAQGGSGLFRLRHLVRGYAEIMATDYGATLVRFDHHELSEKHAEIVRTARREIDKTFRSYIGFGIADGSISACDVKMTAFALAGALNWIGHWYQPDGSETPEGIGEEFALRLTEGLVAQPRP